MARANCRPALLIIAAFALVAATPTAAASEPIMPGTIWTVFTTVEATVVDDHAVVRVIADIGNEGPDPEFPFLVQVPDGAYVTGLTIERDGIVHTARIEERGAARQEYDEHKAREQTGGLVEKQRGSNAYAYLINVAEFTSVRAILTYEQLLSPRDGAYTLDLEAPVSGFGRDLGAAFDVRVESTTGVESAWSAPATTPSQPEDGVYHFTHRVGERPDDAATPFAVSYQLGATPQGGRLQTAVVNGTGMFLHHLRLPATAQSDLPVDMVLVLDTSGSMSGLKIDQMKDAARQLVGRLDGDDRLALVPFSSSPNPAWEGLRDVTNATRADAMGRIDDLFAGGGTNTQDAVAAGFGAFDDATERVPIVLFLTDGRGNGGREDARRINTMDARVFGISFGQGADTGFVAGLARDGGGSFIHVPEGAGAEVDLADFMNRLSAPVATDIRVNYTTPGVDAHVVTPGTLFAGDAYVVVGTFPADAARLEGTLHWTTGDAHAASFAADVDHATWPPQWTRAVIAYQLRDLEARIAAGESGHEADLTQLALAHGYVTDYTSLVLTLAPRAIPADGEDCCWDTAESADGAGAPASGNSRGSQDSSALTSQTGAGGMDDATDDGGMDGADDTANDADWSAGDSTGGDHTAAEDSAEATPPAPIWAAVAALGALAMWRRRD